MALPGSLAEWTVQISTGAYLGASTGENSHLMGAMAVGRLLLQGG